MIQIVDQSVYQPHILNLLDTNNHGMDFRNHIVHNRSHHMFVIYHMDKAIHYIHSYDSGMGLHGVFRFSELKIKITING